jgi:glycerate kinase
MAQKIVIDGKEYEFESLSEAARSQVTNLRATDQEIARTQALLAMLQTARTAYAQTLAEELKGK